MSRWKRIAVAVVAVLVVAAVGAGVYFSLGHHGTDRSIRSVRDDPAVSVSTANGVRVLAPANATSRTALVFYPGARVAPDAYDATFAPLVTRADVTVFVPEMPFNIALLDAGAADSVRARHPEIRTWFVGGHSLGGVAACQYAATHEVRGLVLLASYCNGNVSDRSMAVLSVTGSADTVLDRDAYRSARSRLPPTATFREISGMNHTQFGSYRHQRGDEPAPLSYERAHRRLADVLVPWVRNHSTAA